MADLFDSQYPSDPGYKQTATAKDAAEAMKPRAALLREQVYEILRRCPCTADEVAATLKESVLSIRPRLSELNAAKRIVDTGHRRKNKSGRTAAVWRVL